MDKYTLEKLEENPHYSLSQRQRSKMSELEREEMVEIGLVRPHNNNFRKHSVGRKKVKRFKK